MADEYPSVNQAKMRSVKVLKITSQFVKFRIKIFFAVLNENRHVYSFELLLSNQNVFLFALNTSTLKEQGKYVGSLFKVTLCQFTMFNVSCYFVRTVKVTK